MSDHYRIKLSMDDGGAYDILKNGRVVGHILFFEDAQYFEQAIDVVENVVPQLALEIDGLEKALRDWGAL